MADRNRKIASIVIVVVIAYFLMGLVGVLPAQYDVVKIAMPTQVENIIIEEYEVPDSPNAVGLSAIAVDSSGNVWFSDHYNNGIGKMNNAGTSFNEYHWNGLGCLSGDNYLTFDEDGNLWFPETNKQYYVAKCSPTGTITEYLMSPYFKNPQMQPNLPPPASYFPKGICYDSIYDRIYTAFNNVHQLAKLNPIGGAFSFYHMPVGSPDVWDIEYDNGYVWLVDTMTWNLHRFSIAQETYSQYAFNSGEYFRNMAVDKVTHDVWMAYSDTLIKFSSDTLQFTRYTDENAGDLRHLAIDQVTHEIWIGDYQNHAIVKFNQTTHEFTSYPLPTGHYHPLGIAIEGGTNIWWAEQEGYIGKLTFEEEEEQPQPETKAGITITMTQIGQWTLENGGEIQQYVDNSIMIKAKVKCNDGVKTVQTIYKGTDTPDTKILDMEFYNGNKFEGYWKTEIPAQHNTGTLTFSIRAESDEGNETITSFFDVFITIQPTPQPTPQPTLLENINWSLFFYGGGTLILTAIGIVINRESIPTGKFRKVK